MICSLGDILKLVNNWENSPTPSRWNRSVDKKKILTAGVSRTVWRHEVLTLDSQEETKKSFRVNICGWAWLVRLSNTREREREGKQNTKTFSLSSSLPSCLHYCLVSTVYEIFFTHSGPFYPVALPQTQVRFVPDSIDNPRFDLRTVEQRQKYSWLWILSTVWPSLSSNQGLLVSDEHPTYISQT